MKFNYYYGSQADQFSFIRIPKALLTEKTFSELSIQAKVLYGVLLDRMSLSRKNEWFDAKNRVFIIYQVAEIQEDLGFTKRKAMDLLSELEKFGLLEKKRRGHGLPNILYVKSFMTVFDSEKPGQAAGSADHGTSPPVSLVSRGAKDSTSLPDSPVSRSAGTAPSRSADLSTLRVHDLALQEVRIPAPQRNKSEVIHPEMNQIKSNQITVRAAPSFPSNSGASQECHCDEIRCDGMRSEDDPAEIAEEYRALIRQNIGFDDLLAAHPFDRELIEGIVDLILETALCRTEHILIASNSYPAEVVRSKFLKLDYWHVEYVLKCLGANTTKIRNIKKYLLAVLFNAPSTIDGFYKMEVNHDFPELARAK